MGKEKKDRIMSKEERRIVSYHEVGHALISALQKNSEPVQKITIVPQDYGRFGICHACARGGKVSEYRKQN